MRSLSIGPAELITLAGIAGLALLVAVIVVLAVLRRRRTGAPRLWTWIVALASVLVGLPLVLFVLGLSLVTPVRVQRSSIPPSEPVVVTVGPAANGSDTAPSGTPTPGTSPPNPVPVNDTGSPSWSIVPDTWLEAIAIPAAIAALTIFVGVALVAPVLSRWPGRAVTDSPSRTRYVLLGVALWIALSLFLILDLGLNLAVSIYPGFVAAYAAFWVLVSALLLYRRPRRETILVMSLFVALLATLRFIDWNTRKPFLRRLNRIRQGMTVSQVDRIMSAYQGGYYGGPPPSLRENDPQFDNQGQIVTGWVTYRHTDEGWGNSDWGVVTFEDGRVVRADFQPD
jgi:hypothetical protein